MIVLLRGIIMMDGDRKINFCEGVPLNSAGAANIFLNAGKNVKANSHDGTVIHLKTEKPADVGVHINTTFSIASSKKVKLLFVLNFLLSVLCMLISCSVAFYYWNEMATMRKHMDTLREQYLIQNIGVSQMKPEQSPLVAQLRPRLPGTELREPRMDSGKDRLLQNTKKYYVENLGEDMLLVDSSKKDPEKKEIPTQNLSHLIQKDILVIHFNGAMKEKHLGTNSIIGPWVRDMEVSSKDSYSKIELNSTQDYVTVGETGLYLIYAQIVYLSRAPNTFFMWARQPGQEPRLLATCASANDSSGRPIDKSQLSCFTQTVGRLHKGDTVNLAQREQNRTLWLRPGYTYFGFVKLSS